MCKCGCNKCKIKSTALVLNESKAPSTILSGGLKHHIDTNKPLTEHICRAGSRAYFDLFAEARSLYSRGILNFTNEDDVALLTETNLGHFGIFEGKKVPLDYPIEEGTLTESTEAKWNAVDVSRKAEKELSNKEWNDRTAKKLNILKTLNKSGKFKKDWDEEKLQGWVDKNYSWEKLSRQFIEENINKSILKEGKSEKAYKVYVKNPRTKKVKTTNLTSLQERIFITK